MKVASFNICCDIEKTGDIAWSVRLPLIKQIIREEAFDVFGAQELVPNQLWDLNKESLYEHYSLFRDGGQTGEAISIFYLKARFDLLDTGHFWLSQTEQIPSAYKDAAFKRTCIWVKLLDTQTGGSFYVFNTHFDHISIEARTYSAKLLKERLPQDAPLVLLGDFNSTRESEAFDILNAHFQNAGKENTQATFNGFSTDEKNHEEIDFIFTQQFRVLQFYVVTKTFDGLFASDHYPVVAEIEEAH